MNTGNDLSHGQPATSSGGFAGRDFFYSNLRIQETLTTIRYGIESRKGLIIITGDTGVGKTTLLRKVIADLPANVTGIFVADARISFSDLLRLILRGLDDDQAQEDEGAMVRRCQSLLRARLERCEIVALAVDDAQLMPDRTLRNMMQNFLGGSAEDPEGALLQLVLAGGRGLKTKLAQAALIPLRRRRPMICELQRLSSQEIGAYIEHGLTAANRPAELFDERAVKRVALLSDGNPRAIGALCQRALQLGGAAGAVSAELIEIAAKGVDMHPGVNGAAAAREQSFARFDEEQNFDDDQDDDAKGFEFVPTHSTAAADPAFFARDSRSESRRSWLPRGESLSSWVRVFTVLTLVVGAAAVIPARSINLVIAPAQNAIDLVAGWGEKLKHSAPPPQESRRAPEPPAKVAEVVKGPSEAELRKMAEPEALVPLAGPDRPTAPEEKLAASGLDQSAETLAPQATNSPPAEKVKPGPGTRQNTARRDTVRAAPVKESPSRDLQSEVAKAIASRAIMGVEVSVVQGTAILDGHVATERQRRAAERAARSVVGVERVRNRIAITFG